MENDRGLAGLNGAPALACLAALVAIRCWKTLAVNLPALYQGPGFATAAVALVGVAHLAGCLLVDAAAAFALGRARLPRRAWALAGVACLAAMAMFAVLIPGAVAAGLSHAAALAVLGGVGFEAAGLAGVCWLSRFPSMTRGRCIVVIAGADALLCLVAALAFPWPLVVCVAAPVVFGALAFASREAGAMPDKEPRAELSRWHSPSLRSLAPAFVGVAVLFFGFHFLQVGIGSVDGYGATVLMAAAGRGLAFFVLLALLRMSEEARCKAAFKLAAMVGIAGFLVLPLPVSWSMAAFSVLTIGGCFVAHYGVVELSASMAGYVEAGPVAVAGCGRLAMNSGHCVGVATGAALSGMLVQGSPYLGFVTAAAVLVLACSGIVLLSEANLNRLMWGSGPKNAPGRSLGGEPLGMAVASAAVASPGRLPDVPTLTEREEQVLALLIEGRSVPYIAETLFLGKETVKTHVKHIYQKYGVHGRQELLDLVHCGR